MSQTTVLKLTPNKKEVIINTSVLSRGYDPDVSYPLLFETDKLPYEIDEDTYKFIDSSSLEHANKPYPIDIDISADVSIVNFYSTNKELYNTGLAFVIDSSCVSINGSSITINSSEFTKDIPLSKIDYKIDASVIWSNSNPVDSSFLNDSSFEIDINIIKKEPKEFWEDYDIIKNEYDLSSINKSYTNIIKVGDKLQYLFDTSNPNIYIDSSTDPIYYYINEDIDLSTDITLNDITLYSATDISVFKDPVQLDSSKVEPYDVSVFCRYKNPYNSFLYKLEYRATSNVTIINNASNVTIQNHSYPIVSYALYRVPYYYYYNINKLDKVINNDISILNNKVANTGNVFNNISNNIVTVFRDSAYEMDRHIADIEITVTYFNKIINITTKKVVPIYQKAYPGASYQGNYVYLCDTHQPIDIWTPTLSYNYIHVDEANPKVDIDTSNIISYITIDGSLHTSKEKQRYENINVNRFVNIKNDDIYILNNNGNIVDTPLLQYTGCVDILPYYYDTSSESFVNSNNDVETFIKNILKCSDVIVDDSTDVSNDNIRNITKFVAANDTSNVYAGTSCIINTSTKFSIYSLDGIATHSSIEYKPYTFNAIYATYYINSNGEYNQILKEEKDTSVLTVTEVYDDSSKIFNNYNIDTYYDYSSIKKNVLQISSYNEKNISDYVYMKNIQYMYCINNPVNLPNFLMPVYAVYPILSGYIAVKHYAYDFNVPSNTTNSTIPSVVNYDAIEHDQYGNITINTTNLIKYVNSKIYNQSHNIVIDSSVAIKRPALIRPNVGSLVNFNKNILTDIMLYGVSSELSSKPIYELSITNIPEDLHNNLCVNGITVDSSTFSTSVNIDPYIYSICLKEFPYELNNIPLSYTVKNNGNIILKGTILITNDEGEKHLHKFEKTGKDIINDMESFMLLRANPKLSGNVKLIVDSQYNLYIDTFKSSDILNDSHYRKYPVSAEGNYPRDIRQVFKSLPISELYKTSKNSLNAHKIYTDYADQFETIYEYGAETNTDVLYSENMRILAPLHIGKNIPDFFTIFRYDGVFNEETYNNLGFNDITKYKSLLQNSSVVTTIDLRQYTSIGLYLNNYKDMILNYGYGQCGLQFIELDNDDGSESYRQGKNIWKGILVKSGILCEQTETSYFANKILNDSTLKNKQELFNNYIQSGFERHGLLYPNIINLEFMFNDSDNEEYTMHRYFGLYLYENDFINYDYITDLKIGNNNVLQKYDLHGNLYKGDSKIFNSIFSENYADRIFYAVSNDVTSRVLSENDVNNFLTNNIKNKPEYNIISVNADRIKFDDNHKSFITLHFNKSIQYGEHIRFVLMNVVDKNNSVTSLTAGDNKIISNHIVYDIIASNDERLQYAENNINPYITKNMCDYNNSVIFNRISFYSQDILYPEIPASIEEQIKRIIACINKINEQYLIVSYHDNKSLSIISTHNETYVQHIAAPDLNAFTYDYLHIDKIENSTLHVCTTSKLTNSIEYITDKIEHNIEISDLFEDSEYNYLNTNEKYDSNDRFYLYVELDDSNNIIKDNISYFNKSIIYNMKALSNNTHFYDAYYIPFSLYEFESIGWRHSNIVKFININELHNTYVLYNNIAESVKNISTPLVYTVNGLYETAYKYNIYTGYLNNNIINSHLYKNYSNYDQQINYDTDLTANIITITNPFNSEYDILCSNSDILLTNNVIRLYKPKSASISVMGMCNIKDIDMNVETITDIHRESKLYAYIKANELVLLDESDLRIQLGVMYQVVSGLLNIDNNNIQQGTKFIVINTNNDFSINNSNTDITVYTSDSDINSTNIISATSLIAKTDTVLQIIDKQKYQEYNYTTTLPEIKLSHFFNNVDDIYNSDLMYPVVPQVNCAWKSTGLYLDDNNILDTNNLNKTYVPVGHFTESVFTPDKFEPNQYVINKIENILYIDGIPTTYKDCILNKKLGNSIKKLLISDTNIKTAVCHYNPNTYALEFIYFGIKFVVKFNDKLVNTYIHLDSYNNYEVFILNEYDISKVNEMYVSIEDEFILIVNHQFYIDYAHEADNNIKIINFNNFNSYAPYSTIKSPITLDFTTGYNSKNLSVFNVKEKTGDILSVIDKYNLWSSLFIQEGNNNYVYSPLESIMNHNNLVLFINYKYNYYVNICDSNDSSVKFAYVMTKADGDYNTQIHKLLTHLTNSDTVLNKLTAIINPSYKKDTAITGFNKLLLNLIDKNIIKIPANAVTKKYTNLEKIKVLEEFKNINKFNILKEFNISNTASDQLIDYIDTLTRTESIKEKQQRYIKTITDDIDIYIIPKNSDVHIIQNRVNNNPLMFTLTMPNYIKYNYGWVTPNMNNMVEYCIDDLSLSNIIDTDLLCANTQVSGISKLINYTGNKVYNTSDQKIKLNYFTVPERSLLSSTWDNGYYRLYTGENSYKEYDGLLTGIDDKSFFGSKCMVIKNPYILLDTWKYDTANDLYTLNIIDSEYNTGTSNLKCVKLEINISSVLYHYFINNTNFTNNWLYFKDEQYTGMKNYINYTMVSFYNFNSDIDLLIFKKDTDTYQTINIIETNNPDPTYELYENYKSSISFVNNEYILTIIIDLVTGMDIHPLVKIYKK